MYRTISNSWLKHWDFILLDVLMLQSAYVISCFIRMGVHNIYENQLYLNIGIIICLGDICSAFFMEPYHGIIRRGYFLEFKSVLQHIAFVCVVEIGYLFLSKNSAGFSRLSFLWFVPLSVTLLYLERVLWKHYLIRRKRLFYDKARMLLVTTAEDAQKTLEKLMENSFHEFEIIGIAYIDRQPKENEKVLNVPVVCHAEAIPAYIQTRWVDSVLVSAEGQHRLSEDLINICVEMGVTLHYRLEELENWVGSQHINKMGGYLVLTSTLRIAGTRQVFMKRILDICGGVVGLFLTGLIALFLGPAIYIASPGPIFFSQVRIGKNGKRFKIYKFRSMYMDAEKRKKELMEKNEMQGFMFKMEADPRIIGSGPDGKRHGLGWFMRKTSLDEFPQFWNVLKGDMSLVGTRPPTEDEWKQYKHYHRARMATKPGLTGMWQVSGRNDITDFEEVVRLDMEYIKKWNIGMDIKILMKTVRVVLTGSGSK